MARRLIGLDVGTHAVRVAEVDAADPPRLTTFGQVALPPGAVREGEVVDPGAVTDAIQRLWKELGLRKGAEVRVGLATPRVIVRAVDLPAMPDDDLAGALRFQAQELIPIPLDDAVLDFQVLEPLAVAETPDGAAPTPMNRVLLAAAHREAVDRLVRAVRAAGVRVTAVDLVPLALIRSIGRRVDEEAGGAEALVNVGSGVTVVVVHEGGLPRFVRILGAGGDAVTDAIARELSLEPDRAEALKRQGAAAPAELGAQAHAASERPVAEIAEQVRSSLDYYRTQPDAARLARVVLTGGGSLVDGLVERLRGLTGVPVTLAEPRAALVVGDIGFADEQLPTLDPYLPVPVGLAAGGLAVGKRINLLGADVRPGVDGRRLAVGAVAAGLVVVLGLGALTMSRRSAVADEQAALEEATAANRDLEARAASLADAERTQTEVDTLRNQAVGLLETDVSWSRMLQEIARTIPSDAWLSAFQGSSTPSAGTTASSGGATIGSSTPSTTAPGTTGTAAEPLGGTVSFTAIGLDFPTVAAWLQRMSLIPSFADLWVPSANRSAAGESEREVVDFTSSAALTSAARSDRADRFAPGAP